MNTEIVRHFCPYPTVTPDGKLAAGFCLDHPSQCTKCSKRNCHDTLNPVGYVEGVTHHVCSKGLSMFEVTGPEHRILINGVLDSGQNEECPSRTKKSLRSHKVQQADIERWHRSLLSALDDVTSDVDERVRQIVGGLHDVRTAVNLVYRNAEALVERNPGETFGEKVDVAPEDLKLLLKSVGLLTTRFIASSIVTNPESVHHGNKRWCPVYKVFYRMVL